MTSESTSGQRRDGVDIAAMLVCGEHAITLEAYQEYLAHTDAAWRLWPWRAVATEINQRQTEQ